ncbi:FHIP family protein AGAP011705 isoform X2 [Rhodnius prolixus]|uniref:FHIP family protein AGAP011705 isoform X2 n=1 Tax=Rhodnius prolixus TaxID=13249 RepID=UPI003D18F898
MVTAPYILKKPTIMSWLRNASLGGNYVKHRVISSNNKDFDPEACYESFRKHWQQIDDIINNTTGSPGGVKYDDMKAVVYNLEHMVTLLILEHQSNPVTSSCFKLIISDQILDKLHSWSLKTGRYENALKSEQLRLHEKVIEELGVERWLHGGVVGALNTLLSSCLEVCFSTDQERCLIDLISQLCISFIHNDHYIHSFFDYTIAQHPKFVIFSLLIPYVHSEGTIGQKARENLLLCMELSKKHDLIAEIIALYSDICLVLATELNGLYSNLPRRLDIDAVDWYRLTPDDVNELPPLAAFMNSLDFCNAVVRKAHPLVVRTLLEFIYKGFLVQVMGPALIQSAVYELTTATSYFDAFIRSISEPGLIFCFVKFILTEDYDGQCIIDILIERIHSNSKLCLVTLALLETLVDLNCEDIMLELVFKYLISCNHVMASQRSKINFRDPFCKNAEIFLLLAPNIQRNRRREGSLYGDYHAYLSDARTKIDRCAAATSTWIYKYDGENPPYSEADRSHQSLQSVDETSSGYESIARTGEDLIYSDSDSPRSSDCPLASIKQINSAHSAIIVGPFLQAVLDKLENMLSQHFFINLHLTGLISRLAIYSQPLLRSFLLDESLIFQPSIRSLFQVLRSLKHKIESKLKEISSNQLINLINESESLLLERENKVVNVRKYALLHSIRSTLTSNEDSVTNGRLPEKDFKRSPLTNAFNSVFRRQNGNQTSSEHKLEELQSGYRYVPNSDDLHNLIMSALLLTEWLKELAAISQEHSVSSDWAPTNFLASNWKFRT